MTAESPRNDSQPESVLSAALEYAALGWYVFPVLGKAPDKRNVPRWSEDSSNDPEVITGWYAGDARGLGVAVDLGRSGLAVIDGDHLDEMPADLLATLEAMRRAWTHQGQRSRRSWMFTVGNDAPPQARHPWGEVKAGRGYIVLAPSPHPDQPEAYRWLARPGRAPGPLPAAVRAAVAPAAPKVAPGATWHGGAPTAAEQADARRTLQRVADRLAGWEQGSRNIELNNAALILGHYAPHYLDPDAIRSALLDACKANGLLDDDGLRDCRATIESGLARGMAEPLSLDMLDGLRDPHPPVDTATGEVLGLPALWAASETLQHIHDAAVARNRSPMAVLAACLALASTALGPHYSLPAVVGSRGSLNLFTVLVGRPASGKSTSWAIAQELLPGAVGNPAVMPIVAGGTGQGMMQAYLGDKADETGFLPQERKSAFFYIDEFASMRAAAEQDGSTLLSTLRSMAMGEFVGSQNASHERRRRLLARTYRAGMVIGAQPAAVGALLTRDEFDMGTPQRLLWVQVRKPNVPPAERPAWPGPLDWHLPNVDMLLGDLLAPQEVEFTYPKALVEYVQAQDLLEDVQPVDEHGTVLRLKVAAALAILHGRYDELTAWDWQMAGIIAAHSRSTMEWCMAETGQRAREDGLHRAERRAEQEVVVHTRLVEAKVQRAADAVVRRLASKGGTLAAARVRSGINAHKEFFEEAVEHLVASGRIEVKAGAGAGKGGRVLTLLGED